MRKTPVRHKVKTHTRKKKRVRSYSRGKGNKPSSTITFRRRISSYVSGDKVDFQYGEASEFGTIVKSLDRNQAYRIAKSNESVDNLDEFNKIYNGQLFLIKIGDKPSEFKKGSTMVIMQSEIIRRVSKERVRGPSSPSRKELEQMEMHRSHDAPPYRKPRDKADDLAHDGWSYKKAIPWIRKAFPKMTSKDEQEVKRSFGIKNIRRKTSTGITLTNKGKKLISRFASPSGTAIENHVLYHIHECLSFGGNVDAEEISDNENIRLEKVKTAIKRLKKDGYINT